MQEWHFKISANVLIPGDSNEYNINPENFTSLIRISDYLEKNTPMILARITVDKNLFDKMIENAKTATIHLKIDKFNKNVEGSNYVMQPYIDDEFYMFISNDINYNKELDYIGNEADQMEHKDVYKQVTIGMMSKQCVDENKNVANSCIYNTTMMNIVASNLKDTHLLLEPFTYALFMHGLLVTGSGLSLASTIVLPASKLIRDDLPTPVSPRAIIVVSFIIIAFSLNKK